jgi:hypothetical protein
LIVYIFIRILWFRWARIKDVKLDLEITNAKDYTIMITGLPRNLTEKQVRKRFENYAASKHISNANRGVYRVNFAYYIGDFIKIARKKNEFVKQLFKEKRKKYPDYRLIRENELEIKHLDIRLDVLKTRFTDLKNTKNELFTGIGFITFNAISEKLSVLDAWKINYLGRVSLKYCKCLQRCYKTENERIDGKAVIVRNPPDPGDILWENLGTPFSILFKTRLATFFITVFVLALSFLAILGLKYAQLGFISRWSEGLGKYVTGILIAILISLVNVLLGITVRKISSYEKYITLTEFNSSISRRITFVSARYSTLKL